MLAASAITVTHGAVMIIKEASALRTGNDRSHRQKGDSQLDSPSQCLRVPDPRGLVLTVSPSHSHRLIGNMSNVLIPSLTLGLLILRG